MMHVESHLLNELQAFRFKGEDAKYALVVSHGLAGTLASTIVSANATRPRARISGVTTPAALDAMAGTIGGPVQKMLFEDSHHQLMLFETEPFSEAVHQFCSGIIK